MPVLLFCTVGAACGAFVSFNDHAPGAGTSATTTTWNILGNPPGMSGALKEVTSGNTIPVTMVITTNGSLTADSNGANPDSGTPLYNLFNGYVDFQGAGNADANVQVSGSGSVTYTFSGLNPARTYSFKGAAVRGGAGGTFARQWSLYQLDVARSFTTAHTAGCYTNGLAPNQVAINTGMNNSGDMADWETIVPSANGVITITSKQYTGPIPGGGTASGPCGYVLTGFRMQGFPPIVPVLSSAASAGPNAVKVTFSVPVQPASATNPANYSISGSSGAITIQGAAIGADASTVILSTATLPSKSTLTLSVSGVYDALTGLDVITANSQSTFTYTPYHTPFVAFNDHAPATGTSSNATRWNIFGHAPGSSGYLRDSETGLDLPVVVTITTSGTVTPSAVAGNPDPGTPLYNTFNGWVDFQGAGNTDAVAMLSSGATVTYAFTGLDPASRYTFKAGSVRGGVGGTFPQQWSLVRITGATSFASAHSSGCYTNGLAANLVALNTGMNESGDMVDWENIIPGANGSFTVTASQYTGAIPAGGTASGPNGYALDGFRLELLDTNVFSLVSAANVGNNGVKVTFSASLQPSSATNLANYALTNASGPLPILGAAFGTDNKTILLTTADQLPYSTYWLTVNNVADNTTAHRLVAANSQTVFTNVIFSSGYIKRQLYFNINGTAVSALTSSPNFPDNPDQVDYQPMMGWPQPNIADNYGGRMAGILVAPVSGVYYFSVESDDNSQLFLSTDESPAHEVLLAAEPNWGGSFDANSSAPVTLVAGQHYYIEGLMKEGGGGDYFYVGWKTPTNNSAWVIIPGAFLGSYLSSPSSTITVQSQPSNTTAVADYSATFNVQATGTSLFTTNLTFQWQKNGTDIPGANAPNYTTPTLLDGDNGSVYRVLISIPGLAAYSSNAVLTVIPDTIQPTALRAYNIGTTNVMVIFSKPLEAASASNPANYVFTNAISVTGASLNPDGTSVLLTTTPLDMGRNYTLVINGVRDRATAPNTIATDSRIGFFASPFASQDIGNPPAATISTIVSNGLNITAGGWDIGGASDQFNFSYQQRSGDFDVIVRLAGLSPSDASAKAGLMARDSLGVGALFAAVLATPSMNGVTFEDRASTGGTAVSSGQMPVNYPNTWLRLKRSGSVFTGFASYDGVTWTQLASAAISMPPQIYLGFAIGSHSTDSATVAQFRDFGDAPPNAVIGTINNPHEPLGPCDRKTPLVISEIMYKPAPRSDSNNVEFLELYNSNPFYQDISGYRLSGTSMNYTVPPETILPAGGFIVVAASPQSLANVYGLSSGVLGPYTGSLKKSDTIQVMDERGAVVLTVSYSNLAPWPVAADGTAHSIVLARPTYGLNDPRAWDVSELPGGSPGAAETFYPNPLRSVTINELLAHSENSSIPQFIELYNHSSQSNDLSGCILTNVGSGAQFVIPQGTTINPGGFVSFGQSQLGFTLNGAGGTLFFLSADGSRVLDTVQFEAQADGTSTGRWPDGASEFYPLATPTPGDHNSPIKIGSIVINELMYKPISGNDDDQYLELFNRGTNTVSLAGWQFTSGLTFTFPTNATLAPGAYLVIARNQTNLFAHYTNLNRGNTLGDFGGKLSHSGERVALAQPMPLVTGAVTNTIYVVEDEVTYGVGGRWGQWAKGGGSSLELINPNSDHRLAYNWADSDETQKSSWTNLEFTGVLDNGANYNGSAIDLVQLGLQDVGECLVDNIEVHPGGPTGANIVSNPGFESGLTGWSPQGDHVRSSLETTLAAYQGTRSMHLRSSDSVWTLADYLQGTLTQTTLASGQTATLRLKARWLCGWPEILMRLRGNWLEVAGSMPVPQNLGTPGLPNSRSVTNAGPAIYEVSHSPAIPSVGSPVVVTARFHDVNSFQPTLLYRVDTVVNANPTYSTVVMHDDGVGGDAIAGDGIYSATIPAQGQGTVIAFLVRARDQFGTTTTFPADLKNNAGVPRECVIAFGDPIPPGSFKHQHLFMTQNWANRWAQLGGVSHEIHDGTWVDAGGRIIYNWSGRYAGSPYHQYLGSPITTIAGMHWIMPEDDQVYGTTSFNKQHVPGNGPLDDDTIQREQTAFWMARQIGLPTQNRRYYIFYVNGVRHAPLMEDAQTPGSDMIKEYWPNDSNGWLYKNHGWFEGDSVQQANGYMNFTMPSWCLIDPFTTTVNGVSQYKTARYRWMWWIRQYPDSANDYTNVYALIDAANTPSTSPAYFPGMESEIDTEEWLRMSAIEHATGDWDSFLTQNQWNMYSYKPTQGKWTVLKWDWNISLGSGTQSWPPDGSQLFNLGPSDAIMAVFLNYPPYRRAYLRGLKDIADLAMNNQRVDRLLDAKFSAFAANGLTGTSAFGLAVNDPSAGGGLKTWIGTMHNSILTALNNQNVLNIPFAVDGPQSVTTSGNLVTFTGTAPLEAKTILVDGISYPLTWTSARAWSIQLPLAAASSHLVFQGLDLKGNPLTNSVAAVDVTYTGATPDPSGKVVINEIMYNAPTPGAEFIELFNTSTTYAFDLSGWQIHGLSYTFPGGTTLAPGGFVVVAGNRSAFSEAYGNTIPVADTFSQPPPKDAATLSLTRPGTNGEIVVAQVHYESSLPWPAAANGAGSSLQLVDPSKDNWRVANWNCNISPGFKATPGAANNVRLNLPALPPLWINEVQADNLTGLTNSAGDRVGWVEIYNPTTNAASLNACYLSTTYTNLKAWAFPAGATVQPGEFKVVFTDGRTNLSTLNELHAGIVLPSRSGSLALSVFINGQPKVLDYVNYTNIGFDHSFGSCPDGQSFLRQEFYNPAPGATNPAVSVGPSFISYATENSVYSQDFNSLPNPGVQSVNSANPVVINGIVYSLANPFDFAFPAAASGRTGGLGAPALAGWYGFATVSAGTDTKFGATFGDQTTGGEISFGLPASSDRALGMLATSSTGATAFGVKFINNTASTLSYVSLSATGELWRQSNLPKTLQCSYWIDPTALQPFSTNQTALLPALDVKFPTASAAVGGVPVDGTSLTNQINLALLNQKIADWPPGAAFWLVWSMTDFTGKAQGLAIDNLRFSASSQLPLPTPPLISVGTTTDNRLIITWPTQQGTLYQIEYKTNLNDAAWSPLGQPFPGPGNSVTMTNDLNAFSQCYLRMRLSR